MIKMTLVDIYIHCIIFSIDAMAQKIFFVDIRDVVDIRDKSFESIYWVVIGIS